LFSNILGLIWWSLPKPPPWLFSTMEPLPFSMSLETRCVELYSTKTFGFFRHWYQCSPVVSCLFPLLSDDFFWKRLNYYTGGEHFEACREGNFQDQCWTNDWSKNWSTTAFWEPWWRFVLADFLLLCINLCGVFNFSNG
jgi:hypothetical protein